MKQKQKPGLYPGRIIQFQVCDNYAYYEVETIRQPKAPDFVGEVVVTHLASRSEYGFEGSFKNLRGELVIPLPVVMSNINWADRY